jgi:hypothetical protein
VHRLDVCGTLPVAIIADVEPRDGEVAEDDAKELHRVLVHEQLGGLQRKSLLEHWRREEACDSPG